MSANEVRVLAVLPSLGAGGAERSTVESIRPLADRGVAVELVALRGPRVGVHCDAQAQHVVHDLGALTWRQKALRLREVAEDGAFDVAHSVVFEADALTGWALRSASVRVVTSFVNTQYDEQRLRDPHVTQWKVDMVRRLERLWLRRYFDAYHAISEAAANSASDALGIRRDKIVVVPRGRDEVRLGRRTVERRIDARRALGLGPDDVVILNVGRQEWQKGQDILLEAVHQLVETGTDAQLVIAGRPGAATEGLRTLIRQLGLEHRVRIEGHSDAVPELLCAADLFCFPSRYEGLGGALLEALALEVPIVTTDAAATSEAVGDAAITVPIDDVDSLARSMRTVLSDPARADAMRARGRSRFDAVYSLDAVMDRMAAMYRDIARV